MGATRKLICQVRGDSSPSRSHLHPRLIMIKVPQSCESYGNNTTVRDVQATIDGDEIETK